MTAARSSTAPLLERLLDTTTVESRLSQSVLTGVVTAVMSPARMSTPVRRATHAASGLLGAVGGAVAFAESPPRLRLAAAAGFGGALVGASVLGLALDEAAEGWLRRHGAKRPRVLIGLFAGAFTYATSRAGAHEALSLQPTDATARTAGEPSDEPADEPSGDEPA